MSANRRLSNEGLTIMFEHCTDQPYYPDSGSASGRSSPANSSTPPTPIELFPQSPLDAAVASEDSWNLIPYDVPWGPEYYHYRTGTLPGPDGACIFLRSPTPLKNRRTQKACNKCRQRKAKCSGTRPTCTRCLARGYICQYVEEDKPERRVSVQPSFRSRRRDRHAREGSVSSCVTADASYTVSDCESNYVRTKLEEVEPQTPELLYTDGDSPIASTSSPTEFGSQWDESSYPLVPPCGYEHATETYSHPAVLGEYFEQPGFPVSHAHVSMFQDVPESHPAAASVHAPRPVRCTGSPPFLTPEERMGAFAPSVDTHGMTALHGMQQHHNDMLINIAAASEPAPQIALPQVPPMAPTGPALAEVAAVAVEYAQPQAMYYYDCADVPMQYAYPDLPVQYHYSVQGYMPAGMQESIAPSMLYSVPILPTGMTA